MPFNKNKIIRTRKLIVSKSLNEDMHLIEALAIVLPETTRTTRKQYLRDRCVLLKGKPTTQHDALVKEGDKIEVYNIGFSLPFTHPKVNVIWQDDYFILIEKMSGIATIGNHSGLKETVFRLIANYIKQDNSSHKIFLLNRLDSESHGLILFCKDRALQQKILDDWGKYILIQEFSAVVEGLFEKPEGEIKGFLRKKGAKVKSTKPTTRRSSVSYKVDDEGDWSSLVTLTLHGRFNGIRTILKESQHPIVGENTPTVIYQHMKSLMLRQTLLVLRHPITNQKHIFRTKTPSRFRTFLERPITRGEESRIYAQQRMSKSK